MSRKKLYQSSLLMADAKSKHNNYSTTDSRKNKEYARPCAEYIDRGSYWVYMYYLLMVYQQREGHVNVPYRHVEDGWKLGNWLSDQRRLYQRNELEPSRRDRLAMANVAWNLQERQWELMFDELEKFCNTTGHANVPQHYTIPRYNGGGSSSSKLGQWLNTQRAAKRKNKMSEERQDRLEALGVAWNQQEAKWNHMYSLLQQYRAREGHTQIRQGHVESGEKLGTWFATQKKHIRLGKISDERYDRLAALGIVDQVIEELGRRMDLS